MCAAMPWHKTNKTRKREREKSSRQFGATKVYMTFAVYMYIDCITTQYEIGARNDSRQRNSKSRNQQWTQVSSCVIAYELRASIPRDNFEWYELSDRIVNFLSISKFELTDQCCLNGSEIYSISFFKQISDSKLHLYRSMTAKFGFELFNLIVVTT